MVLWIPVGLSVTAPSHPSKNRLEDAMCLIDKSPQPPRPLHPMRLGRGHCCMCWGAPCNHIGMMLCEAHKLKPLPTISEMTRT